MTEIWRDTTTGEESTIHRDEPIESLSQKLLGYKFGSQRTSHNCIVRVIYAGYNPAEPDGNLPSATINQILDTFNLKLAFDFFTSCFAGVSSLPIRKPSIPDIRSYAFSYHPKLALIWSYESGDSGGPLTQAVCFAMSQQRQAFMRLLERRWQSTSHAMLLPFLCSLLLSFEVDDTLRQIKQQVREVEVRTGHHRFANRKELPARESLGELSAQMHGCSTKLASVERKLKIIDILNMFVLNNSETGKQETTPPQAQQFATLFQNNISVIRSRAIAQEIDKSYILQRTQAQISAVSDHSTCLSNKIYTPISSYQFITQC